MRKSKLLLAATLLAAFSAHAQVTPALTGNTSSFLSLSSSGLSSGITPVATLTGGTVYTSDQPFADIPFGGVFESHFLAAGPSSGAIATLNFLNGGVGYVSFLWGSPDLYNELTVTTTAGMQTFTAAGLGFSVTNGNQGASQYVQFTAIGTSLITALSFTDVPATDAFETANFSVTAPVPEPETYALMLAGLAALGYVGRRRRNTQV